MHNALPVTGLMDLINKLGWNEHLSWGFSQEGKVCKRLTTDDKYSNDRSWMPILSILAHTCMCKLKLQRLILYCIIIQILVRTQEVFSRHEIIVSNCTRQSLSYETTFHKRLVWLYNKTLWCEHRRQKLYTHRKPGWLWTDFHYFHKYLHNDELNSRFHMGISKYHVRAAHIIYLLHISVEPCAKSLCTPVFGVTLDT